MTDPAFHEVETRRELSEGVHESEVLLPVTEREMRPMDPPWTVYFRSRDKLRHGRFHLRAWSFGEAESMARRRLADDEIVLEIRYGLRDSAT